MTGLVYDGKGLILPVSTQKSFDSCKSLLKRVEIGGIGWEEQKLATFP
jgi:hypothetical protein